MKSVLCPYCQAQAPLTTGKELYPHRSDLFRKLFYRCEPCDAYVGCHREGAWSYIKGQRVVSDGTLPLGTLANKALRQSRSAAHLALDTLWTVPSGRTEVYAELAKFLDIEQEVCHIGMFNEDQCLRVQAFARKRNTLSLDKKRIR